jgi:hypothetical protein
MHVRSACSRAAHPCAVWPEDAQHPVRNQCRVHMSQRSRPGSHLNILLCSKLSHTQYCAHDTQTWVRIRLVRLANAQLRERGQFGRGGSLRQLVRCVFPGNHVYRGRYGLVRSVVCSFEMLVFLFDLYLQLHLRMLASIRNFAAIDSGRGRAGSLSTPGNFVLATGSKHARPGFDELHTRHDDSRTPPSHAIRLRNINISPPRRSLAR